MRKLKPKLPKFECAECDALKSYKALPESHYLKQNRINATAYKGYLIGFLDGQTSQAKK